MILMGNAPAPRDVSVAFALATGDVMRFTTGAAPQSTHRMARLEKALADRNIEKYDRKDVTGTMDGTGSGCALSQGGTLRLVLLASAFYSSPSRRCSRVGARRHRRFRP